MARPISGYRLKCGTRVPGVTTICGRFGDKGGLIPWAYNRGLDGQPLYESRDDAADIGTHVHDLVEWHANGENGEPPEPPESLTVPQIAQAKDSYTMALKWEAITRYQIVSWERPLVSEKYAYGGTPDAIFQSPLTELYRVGDWKTGKGIYLEALLQTAGGYTILLEENYPDWRFDGIDIVRFSKEALVSDHKIVDDKRLIELAKTQFLRFREAWDAEKELQRMFG